jgi:two-component system cell cycle sensor histidine kinase/response regulator CckA
MSLPARLRTALGRLGGRHGLNRPRRIRGLPLDELFGVLLHDAPSGLLVLDRNGLVVRANAALCRMAGRDNGLGPGSRADALFPPDERTPVARELALHLAGKAGAREFATRLRAPEGGSETTVDVSVQVLHEADGKPSGLVLWLTDTSRQQELEAQLAHGQKLQAVGQLAGGIAHDFNNLLTAITGAAELILSRGADAGTVEDVQQIRASAERGAALVRQLLAFGRQQRLQPRIVPINAAISEVSSLLRRLLGGKIQLELELEEPGRTVKVDPTQLDQVLINLAVNARDAMPEGGQLFLRSGHITLFRPLLSGHETIPPGRYVMIEVEDTGCGIPPDVLPRIFDPFFTTRRERGGSGLGLATAHGIVRQSEGFIAVESEPGKGTRFRIYLPRHDADQTIDMPPPPSPLLPPVTAAAGAGEPAAEAAGGRRALVVEDEPAVGRIAERALRKAGWEVHLADSAEAVLANLDTLARPDVLVSDVVMPGMDGPSLVRRLRERWPGLPAVLVSGYVEESLRRDIEAESMTFLAKPYTLADLLAAAVARASEKAGASTC